MKTTRRLISSGSPWETKVGYSRAVRVGSHIHVSGTTSSTADGLVGRGDPYAQAVQALRTIQAALAEAGATAGDVVRTRIYITRVEDWPDVGRAHGEVFGEIRPATTLLVVAALVDPDMLVEIEAEALLDE